MTSAPLIQQLDALFDQLETIFEQQLEAAVDLEKLLQDENEALIKRKHEKIQQIAQQKESRTAELESLSQQQSKLFKAAKQPYTPDAFEKMISAAPGNTSKKIRHLKGKLETVLQVCQEKNIINGHILAVNKQSAEAALAILRGQISPSNLTYGAAGQPVKEESSTCINKA
jgi:flagella synthesis protein FlgN